MWLSNYRSTYKLEKRYWPFLWGASRLNNRYYVLNLKNKWWWLQQRTKIHMVELILLTGSSGLSNSLIKWILYLSKQLLEWHIWCKRIIHQIESIAYGLYIIIWIQIPTGRNIRFNAWIDVHRSKIVYRILLFDVNIKIFSVRESGCRFEVHRNSLGDAANTPNSSNICTFQ